MKIARPDPVSDEPVPAWGERSRPEFGQALPVGSAGGGVGNRNAAVFPDRSARSLAGFGHHRSRNCLLLNRSGLVKAQFGERFEQSLMWWKLENTRTIPGQIKTRSVSDFVRICLL